MRDLDLPSKRARVISKGGAIEWAHWRTSTAMLPPGLLTGRDRDPVFLAERGERILRTSLTGCISQR